MAHIINNNGVITVYNTIAEFEAAVALITPTTPAMIALIARLVKAEKADRICKELLKDLNQTLQSQSISAADEDDLVTRINSVLMCLLGGFLNGALNKANGLTPGGALTTNRRTFLINAITAAIAELNA